MGSASSLVPGKRPQFLWMSPDIGYNAVSLLRPATVAVWIGLAQDVGFEFVDPVENRHPTLFDRLDAQTEICAKFGVGLAVKSRSQELLFRRAQTEYWWLVTIHCCGKGVRCGESALSGHNGQCALGSLKFCDQAVRSGRAGQGDP